MSRYVRKNRSVYANSLCKRCGTAGGCGPSGCDVSTCGACGTAQCSSNGLGRGQCSVCYVGLLSGWSGSREGQACTYKGCQEHAVARGRGNKLVCAGHLARQQPDLLTSALARREQEWTVVA